MAYCLCHFNYVNGEIIPELSFVWSVFFLIGNAPYFVPVPKILKRNLIYIDGI